MKYNLQEALDQNYKGILTFGGAFSNHIIATAAACNEKGLSAVGLIRGEELANKWHKNPTLQKAHEFGMQFKFVSRSDYKRKENQNFLSELNKAYPNYFIVHEGGTNDLAIRGCAEILDETDSNYDYICVSMGTGGTFQGIHRNLKTQQTLLGFPALKGIDFENLMPIIKQNNYKIVEQYNFGGYAKTTNELITFINDFYQSTRIPLDPIYTGKMVYGILDLVKQDYFEPDTNILAIHTGGLQGILGINEKLKKKNKLTIQQ